MEILNFYYLFIEEMIDLGGDNLPKSVSAKLGGRLGKAYKKKGIKNVLEGLKKRYKELNLKSIIKKIDKNSYKISIDYGKCPFGGGYNPDRTKNIQNYVCIPFLKGFLKEIDGKCVYIQDIKQCVLNKKKRKMCLYFKK